MIIPTCRNCYFDCCSDVRESRGFLCDLWEYFLSTVIEKVQK